MEKIAECLKNANIISAQIDDNIEYNKFLLDLKELVDNKQIDETNMKNPFTFLLQKLPEKYYKYINMMYTNYFKKFSDAYNKASPFYLGKSLLSDDGKIIVPLSQNDDDKIIVPLSQNDDFNIDEFGAFGIAMLYYNGLSQKINKIKN
jgi:hypothetical protein